MIETRIKHETGNGLISGYGVWINCYVRWQGEPDDAWTLYASHCVLWGEDTLARIRLVERITEQEAIEKAFKDWMGEN